jgi:hypothetical protein
VKAIRLWVSHPQDAQQTMLLRHCKATECIQNISTHNRDDLTYLYACVLEAQQVTDKRQAIRTLQIIVEKYDAGAPSGVHFPALLRCTARLLFQEIRTLQECSQQIIDELINIFKCAIRHAHALQLAASATSKQFSHKELEWFSRNSYNLALQYCGVIEADRIVDLATVCLNVNVTLTS